MVAVTAVPEVQSTCDSVSVSGHDSRDSLDERATARVDQSARADMVAVTTLLDVQQHV